MLHQHLTKLFEDRFHPGIRRSSVIFLATPPITENHDKSVLLSFEILLCVRLPLTFPHIMLQDTDKFMPSLQI